MMIICLINNNSQEKFKHQVIDFKKNK